MDFDKSISQAMEKNGLTDERELFRSFMYFLKDDYVQMLQGGNLPVFCPSRIKIAGDAKTLAEFIRNLASFLPLVWKTRERDIRAAGREGEADNYKKFIANMRAVVDILNSQLPGWTAEGDQSQARGRDVIEEFSKLPGVVSSPLPPPSCPTCGQFLPT
jgi:hypothetical protein